MEDVQQKLEELKLDSMEEISKEFNTLQLICIDYEESCGDQSECKFEDAIKRLQILQKAIINQSIFSPNEEFKEIKTEHLKYLLLPFYIGDVFGRMSEYRIKNLEYSKIYLSEYIKLVDHYGLVSEKLRSTFKNITSEPKWEPTREDKIQQFRDQKEIEKRIKNLDMIKDESEQRDAVKAKCELCIYHALDFLKSIKMEMEILEYKRKIQEDEEAKEEYEAHMKRPIPQLKYWSIPKQEKGDLPYMLNQQGQGQGQQQGHGLCEQHYRETLEEIKQRKKQEVWRPDISQPTVRLEELADLIIKDKAIGDQMQKEFAQQQAMERGSNYDSDGEDEHEKKRLEQTAWDDWKDENEKGAGNTGNTMNM